MESPRLAKRGNRGGVPETNLGRMQFHPNGKEISRDVFSNALPGTVVSHIGGSTASSIEQAMRALIRDKAVPFVRAWLDYAKPANVDRFVDVLAGLHARVRTLPGDGKRLGTTYMEELAHQVDTRYLGPAASLAPEKLGDLYADHIFKPEAMPGVRMWLAEASDRSRDHFRDAFTSITNYYKGRKGPRSDYAENFKNKEPSFVARRRAAEEKEAEFITQSLNQHLNATQRTTANDYFAARPYTPSSARGGANAGGNPFAPAQPPQQLTAMEQLERMKPTSMTIDTLREADRRAEEALAANSELANKMVSSYGFMIKPQVHDTVRTWVNFCSASNRKKLEYVLHAIKRSLGSNGGGGGGGAASGSGDMGRDAGNVFPGGEPRPQHMSMYETTSASASHLATGGFVSDRGSSLDPQHMVKLYAGSIFREEYWPGVAVWLARSPQNDIDKFRDSFSSLSSFHQERKGPRTVFHRDFKVISRKKREAIEAAKRKVLSQSLTLPNAAPQDSVMRRRPFENFRDPGTTLEVQTARANNVTEKYYEGSNNDYMGPSSAPTTPRVAFGDSNWAETDRAHQFADELSPENLARRKEAEISAMLANQAKRKVDRFSKPEQESNMGYSRKHGGFFSKTEYQRSLKWKDIEREDREIAVKIKQKNTRGNDPISSITTTGIPETTYRNTFKGQQTQRPAAVTAEFYE